MIRRSSHDFHICLFIAFFVLHKMYNVKDERLRGIHKTERTA